MRPPNIEISGCFLHTESFVECGVFSKIAYFYTKTSQIRVFAPGLIPESASEVLKIDRLFSLIQHCKEIGRYLLLNVNYVFMMIFI